MSTCPHAWRALVRALALATLLAAPAAPSLASVPTRPDPPLQPGQSAITNDLVVQCLADRVRLSPVDSSRTDAENGRRGLAVHRSGGPLGTSQADCRFSDGTTMRVKSGQRSPPMPYGQCGATPGERLSVWIDRRRVVSSFDYSSRCEDQTIRSLEIRRSSATVCIPPADSASFQGDSFGDLRNRGLDSRGCTALPLARPKTIDALEYPARAADRLPAGSLTLEAASGMADVCSRLMPAGNGMEPVVPEDLPGPDWQRQALSLPQPDLEHVGFNATTLSADGVVDAATFDLENTGRRRLVYRQESTNHWFDGTALAIDTPGVLTVPFDAHNARASLGKGIHVWVYDHAEIFFDGGHTYVLLRPVNGELDARVVALQADREETVCQFHRKKDRF